MNIFISGGGSAGAIILGNSISISSDENIPEITNLNALNVLNFDIWPHYKEH